MTGLNLNSKKFITIILPPITSCNPINGVTTNYYLNCTQIIAEETNGNITEYLYNSTGVIGFRYRASTYAADKWDIYFFEKNLQGDIVAVYTSSGVKKISYTYDAWGNFTKTKSILTPTVVVNNPFTYRGYYYDKDLGLYYLNSRYYDSQTGRFISADAVGFLGANMDLNSYNLYAYCSNNPVMHTDPSGHLIGIIAFFVGVCALAGGASAYNSAKESGVQGEELFWETAKGAGKGAAVGAALSTLACVAGGTIATYGFNSVAGTAVITATVSVVLRAEEVSGLQYQKSQQDGKSGWQITNDVIQSLYDNGGKILLPLGTKGGSTMFFYNRSKAISPHAYYSSNAGIVSYLILLYNSRHYLKNYDDPVIRAQERGYSLR